MGMLRECLYREDERMFLLGLKQEDLEKRQKEIDSVLRGKMAVYLGGDYDLFVFNFPSNSKFWTLKCVNFAAYMLCDKFGETRELRSERWEWFPSKEGFNNLKIILKYDSWEDYDEHETSENEETRRAIVERRKLFVQSLYSHLKKIKETNISGGPGSRKTVTEEIEEAYSDLLELGKLGWDVHM